jgi:hypothetical protein
MSHEQIAFDHISDQKLREIAVRILQDRGFVALTSIATTRQAAHLRKCGKCLDAVANIARELSRDIPDQDVS